MIGTRNGCCILKLGTNNFLFTFSFLAVLGIELWAYEPYHYSFWFLVFQIGSRAFAHATPALQISYLHLLSSWDCSHVPEHPANIS
jgi:hypothetical protein